MIFANITELKTYVGGAANFSLSMDSINPQIDIAAEKHLIPYIGHTLWQHVLDNLMGDTHVTALLPYLRKTLGFLSLYEYVQIGGIQLSEAGIFRIESEREKSAYKYQTNDFKSWMLNAGYEKLEELLRFLEENKANYSQWTSSDEYNRHQELLIRYASDLRNTYSKYVSRHIYEMVRPIMLDIEAFTVEAVTGATLLNSIRTRRASDSLTTADKDLIPYLYRVVTHFTIDEALKRNWVRLDSQLGVVQMDALEPQSSIKKGPASMQANNVKTQHHENWGNRHLARLKQFLKDNEDDYPEYATYQASLTSSTTTTTTTTTDNNRDECPSDYTTPKKEKTKGFVKL